MQLEKGPCFYRPGHVTTPGIEHWGYRSWQELWMDYTVFTVARNPFDRAASAYDYITGRRMQALVRCLYALDPLCCSTGA